MTKKGIDNKRQAIKMKARIKPSFTPSKLKKEFTIPHLDLIERTICLRLQKELDLPSRRAALNKC